MNVDSEKDDLQCYPDGEPEVEDSSGTASGTDYTPSQSAILGESKKGFATQIVTILFAFSLCVLAILHAAGVCDVPTWFLGIAGAYIGGEKIVGLKRVSN